MNKDFGAYYPILDNLNKTDTVEEIIDDNNNVNENILDDEEIVEKIDEHLINKVERVEIIADGNIISDDERYIKESWWIIRRKIKWRRTKYYNRRRKKKLISHNDGIIEKNDNTQVENYVNASSTNNRSKRVNKGAGVDRL